MRTLTTIYIFLIATMLWATDPTENGLNVGDKAPDFSLQNVDNTFVSLSDYKDAKGFIVIFTCNTCPYAINYEDRIIELDKKYSSQGYQLIAINPNDPEVKPGDSREAMKQRAEEKGFAFPYLFDAGQIIYPQYGATKTPHVFILDAEHIVKYMGAIDDNAEDASAVTVNFVDKAIGAMERDEEPYPSATKAIGCTIKVKKEE